MDLRKFWKSPAECSSIYGGFKANENNMHNMVKYHLEDSFKFLLMVRHRPLPLFVFLTGDPEQNVNSFMTPVSDSVFNAAKLRLPCERA